MSKLLNIKILISLFFLFFLFLGPNDDAHAVVETKCSPDYVNDQGEVNLGAIGGDIPRTCLTAATNYEFVIYDIKLCRSLPVASTTSSAIGVSDCENVLINEVGETFSLTPTGTYTFSSGSVQTPPPPGTYTYGYFKLSTQFGISGKVTFSDQQYNGQESGTGTTCVTTATPIESITGSTFPQRTSVCGNENLTPEMKYMQYQSFGCCDGFTGGPFTINDINNSGQNAIITLVDNNGFKATNEATSQKIDYVIQFANPITISQTLNNLNLRFNISTALEINNENGSGDMIMLPVEPETIFEVEEIINNP